MRFCSARLTAAWLVGILAISVSALRNATDLKLRFPLGARFVDATLDVVAPEDSLGFTTIVLTTQHSRVGDVASRPTERTRMNMVHLEASAS